jgi:hypothetical protein
MPKELVDHVSRACVSGLPCLRSLQTVGEGKLLQILPHTDKIGPVQSICVLLAFRAILRIHNSSWRSPSEESWRRLGQDRHSKPDNIQDPALLALDLGMRIADEICLSRRVQKFRPSLTMLP